MDTPLCVIGFMTLVAYLPGCLGGCDPKPTFDRIVEGTLIPVAKQKADLLKGVGTIHDQNFSFMAPKLLQNPMESTPLGFQFTLQGAGTHIQCPGNAVQIGYTMIDIRPNLVR